VDGGDLVDVLSFIRLHADALRTLGFFKIPILDILPGLSPSFGVAAVIPVGSEDLPELPLAVLALHTVALFIEDVLPMTLGQPVSFLVHGSHGHHQMSVRIVVRRFWFMDGDIDDHPSGHKLLLDELPDQFDVLLHR
jgi:hypothetical protein